MIFENMTRSVKFEQRMVYKNQNFLLPLRFFLDSSSCFFDYLRIAFSAMNCDTLKKKQTRDLESVVKLNVVVIDIP